jgi:hypothetical protein
VRTTTEHTIIRRMRRKEACSRKSTLKIADSVAALARY